MVFGHHYFRMLQCVAVCCGVLWCVAQCCNVFCNLEYHHLCILHRCSTDTVTETDTGRGADTGTGTGTSKGTNKDTHTDTGTGTNTDTDVDTETDTGQAREGTLQKEHLISTAISVQLQPTCCNSNLAATRCILLQQRCYLGEEEEAVSETRVPVICSMGRVKELVFCTATHGNTLQHIATHCNRLQHIVIYCGMDRVKELVALIHCNTR